MRKWQGYIDYAFANDIPLVDLMEKAYQMGRIDAKEEYENADIPIIHGKEELELHDSRIRADERANAIREYKSKLIKDVSARAKSYEQYSDKINAEVFNYATDTFLQALDYFAEQLKEQSNDRNISRNRF